MAVVSQEITLFRGSLRENLRYAAPDASAEAVAQAVRDAQLDSLVEQLPQGLETPLGERGQRLSGGQKQRLCIARALLQRPAVLVLDEATSAVDEATEQQVIAAIDRLVITSYSIHYTKLYEMFAPPFPPSPPRTGRRPATAAGARPRPASMDDG